MAKEELKILQQLIDEVIEEFRARFVTRVNLDEEYTLYVYKGVSSCVFYDYDGDHRALLTTNSADEIEQFLKYALLKVVWDVIKILQRHQREAEEYVLEYIKGRLEEDNCGG